MRNANEMYQFCLDNGYGQGFNTKNSLNHFKIIEKNLAPDEDVLFAFIGLHNYISVSKHDNNFAYAVTTKRFLMGQKKVIGEVFQSVAFNKINDITLQTGLVYGVITIDAQTETFNVAVIKHQALNINSKIHDLLLDLKNDAAGGSAISQYNSAADEIRKYKSLLDDGIITKEEFDLKKKQLLS